MSLEYIWSDPATDTTTGLEKNVSAVNIRVKIWSDTSCLADFKRLVRILPPLIRVWDPGSPRCRVCVSSVASSKAKQLNQDVDSVRIDGTVRISHSVFVFENSSVGWRGTIRQEQRGDERCGLKYKRGDEKWDSSCPQDGSICVFRHQLRLQPLGCQNKSKLADLSKA